MLKKKNRSCSSSTITTIQSLPKDLLVEIVASVASHSSDDLFNVKKSCKDLLDAEKDYYVYRRISLDKFPFIPWRRSPTTEKLSLFLKYCKENQNTESLYREGLQEFLGNNGNMEEGLRNLDMVAKKGPKEVKYVYGMILLCSSSMEDEKSVELGLGHLRFLRESKCVVRTRNMNPKRSFRKNHPSRTSFFSGGAALHSSPPAAASASLQFVILQPSICHCPSLAHRPTAVTH
ncbi:hypothetical protein PIB30_088262 [Stylosanthes scabra]|uniref:At2g35280-like TPR domain-containing protein n=1 Tax=Stylosanthes scabra TaxID=79078 RepID=A0ABU6YRA1_9FABA|nr:hypothetical protein [Stylosanthes scabra]